MEVSRVTVVMDVPFRSQFIMQAQNRHNFNVRREGDNVGKIFLVYSNIFV
jgi:hypothetical protein